MGMEIDCVPPRNESDVYGGFFVIKTSGESAVRLLKALVGESGYYEEGYRRSRMQRQVEVFREPGNQADLSFKNSEGETKMFRVQSGFSFDEGRDVELTFGGGGNQTTYDEMHDILCKGPEALLSEFS